MLRAIRLLPAGERRNAACIDTVILTSAQRRAAKGEVVGVKGTHITFDLPAASHMHTDDVLVLEDGRLVEVFAAAEPLYEVRIAELASLARLAWQLGDRHIAVEILPNRIRMRREPAVEALLTELGVKVSAIEAPFEPQGGAYSVVHDHSAHDHAMHDQDHHGHHHNRKAT